MVLAEDEELNSDGVVMATDDAGTIPDAELECNNLELLCPFDSEILYPKTTKLGGKIKGVLILILVDTGASNNFISRRLVKAMELSMENIKAMGIKLSDGQRVATTSHCARLKVDLWDLNITIDALILELEEINLILDVSWLQTLGATTMDWQKMSMQFQVDGQGVTLRGFTKPNQVSTSLQSLLEEDKKEVGRLLWTTEVQCQGTNIPSTLSTQRSRELHQLLAAFSKVFKEPKGLPPQRMSDHVILLQEGCGPVNVRPYRYPHHQKNEIEK